MEQEENMRNQIAWRRLGWLPAMLVCLAMTRPAAANLITTTIDFESVAPGTYSSLEISGFKFSIFDTDDANRSLQIVDLDGIMPGFGLSHAITAANISDTTYDKGWGLLIERADPSQTFGFTDFDIEGWEDPTGNPQASSYSTTICSSTTCIGGSGTLTDALIGYQAITGFGASAGLVIAAIDSLAASSGPGMTPSPGYLFLDNLTLSVESTAIPEPSILALMVLGIAGICYPNLRKGRV